MKNMARKKSPPPTIAEPAAKPERRRRTPEERRADLEAKIEALTARAAELIDPDQAEDPALARRLLAVLRSVRRLLSDHGAQIPESCRADLDAASATCRDLLGQSPEVP